MNDTPNGNEFLIGRIQQLEHERDELHKDIEQLCMQQAGPDYLSTANRMHIQKTAGLEQEIENLKKKLAACTRENINLQEELSEAYRIKSQLADLHSAEVSKSIEAEKQVKFFQSCVAAAFAERDHSVVQAEKAKEMEELISSKLDDLQKRLEELTSECLEEKELTAALKTELEKKEKQNEIFKSVVDKFYEIRQHSSKGFEDTSLEKKGECLLHDSEDMWAFHDNGETSTSKYMSDLEEKVQTLRKSMDNLQNKLKMGLDIENHLKKKVRYLEKEKILLEERITKGLSGLQHQQSQNRIHIMDLLDEGYSHLKSIITSLEPKLSQLSMNQEQSLTLLQIDVSLQENRSQDLRNNTDAGSELIIKEDVSGLTPIMTAAGGDASEALAQALQEKVSALLLLSQQEERHLLEKNVNAALQKKVEELHRNLLQVTSEKVRALLELARVKHEYQQLQEKVSQEIEQGKLLVERGEKKTDQDRDGRLKNLLKKTYLRRWIGPLDPSEQDTEADLNNEWNFSSRRSSYNIDFARMKIENATLRESLECVEHLTSSVRRLRGLLLKVIESFTSEGENGSLLVAVGNIFAEAELVKTALGSSLPVSWSGEADAAMPSGQHSDMGIMDGTGCNSSSEKVEPVSAAGFEMVQLLLLSAQLLKDKIQTQRRHIDSN